MFAWATPEYLLDYMTLDEVFFYYQKGLEFEQTKGRFIVNELGKALSGKDDTKNKSDKPDKPDKEAFYKYYGDKIERPGGD